MKKLIIKIKKSKFIKDNFVLLVCITILNILGFLFHFYMGRKLGPADYGVLGTILALVYLAGISFNTIQISIAKFVSKFKAKKEYGKISFLLNASIKKLTIYGIIATIIFILISKPIASFLHINISPLILLSPIILFISFATINRGILQGLQKFKGLGITFIGEGVIKFFGGVLLVSIGWRVNGAILAIVLSYLAAFFIGFYPLKKISKHKKTKFETKPVYKYSLPVLVTLLSLTAYNSIDLILVKHFFNNIEAGYYAAISLIGKVLFFGTISISQVMFPKVSELHEAGKVHKPLLYKSLLITLVFIIPIIAIYFLFPSFIVNLLYGKEYLAITGLIGWFSVFVGLFCLVYILAFYNMSIHKMKFLYVLLIFNLIEIFLLYNFHQSLMQIITILTILMLILFLILSVYTLKTNKKSKDLNILP
ncbi:MAG: oligosaccharide flippase family protein [Nanoarchaeota archaeon]|nr:oligosaccharide flippase family protein [Nanoarchaeota archaeon]